MGSAIAILAAEHAAIQRAVGLLGRLCEQAATGAAHIHTHSAGQVLEFLREFAERCHNAKEEELLFPALIQRGIPSNHGLLAAQLAGRRQGRQLMDAMTRAQAAWAAGKAGAGGRFSAAATFTAGTIIASTCERTAASVTSTISPVRFGCVTRPASSRAVGIAIQSAHRPCSWVRA